MVGWDSNVAIYFNENKINYNYEPETFVMPNGRTYTPDFYLPEENLWVEVKGRFYDEESREKWIWFNQAYENSELWDKQKLKEIGIL